MTPSRAFRPSVRPSCLSLLTLLACLLAVIQVPQLLRRWKNAGPGASPPGRQLGSPSLTLKTRYPPEWIPLAYRPDPLSEPPRAAPPGLVGVGGGATCPPCLISAAPRCPSRRFRTLKTHVQTLEEPAGNNRLLMGGQAAQPLGSLSPKKGRRDGRTAGRTSDPFFFFFFFFISKIRESAETAAERPPVVKIDERGLERLQRPVCFLFYYQTFFCLR